MNINQEHKYYGKCVMMRTIEGEPYRFFQDNDKSISMIPLSVLSNQSPTSQTKSLRDFPNGEHNTSLKTPTSSPSKLPSATSLNNNINRNYFNRLGGRI